MKTSSILKSTLITMVIVAAISCKKESFSSFSSINVPPQIVTYNFVVDKWVKKSDTEFTSTFANILHSPNGNIPAIVKVFLQAQGNETLIGNRLSYLNGTLKTIVMNSDLIISYSQLSVKDLPFEKLTIKVVIQ